MNKKGLGRFVIGGISIGALIYFIFQFLVTGLVIDTVTTGLTEALINLEGNMICPPELSEEEFNICFSSNGEVIVNGSLKKNLELKLSEKICSIPSGEYENVNVCILENFWQSERLYISGLGFWGSKTLKISRIISYAKAGDYLRILKFIRYIPIK